ncbi:uncharacterized protein LOC142319643 [Lycorma delicatula]|uniref:uncharacterized protein LOC142319643 n=1 Tax=Lycorma delicatula TaxID=130591 RepID=UPI003F513336
MDATDERTKLYDSGAQCFDLIIQRIYENFTGAEVDDNIAQLKEIFNNYSELQEDWTLASNCVDKIRENYDNILDDSVDVCEVHETLFKNEKEDFVKKNDKNKFNNEFDMKLTKVTNAVKDNDLMETQSSINLIDPISKKIMTNPVKNIICNHTYEMETITIYINDKKNKRPRCPYQGCCNMHPLSLSDLIPDQLALQQLHKESH